LVFWLVGIFGSGVFLFWLGFDGFVVDFGVGVGVSD
jgi:hypothetical protein